MSRTVGLRIHVTGVVQGVGFRPFVFGLAERHALRGWVRNTSSGVDIEVEGRPESVRAFAEQLRTEAPPLARIHDLEVASRPPDGYTGFSIVPSAPVPGAYQPVSPDVATCDACLAEVRDPSDRRHAYPFTNCTNCGPRFTIITDIPYDRPNTTMAGFPLCADCAREYADPRDRRFHAQPVACPVCGPTVWLEAGGAPDAPPTGPDAIAETRRRIAAGGVVAIKGLGGFHLACDATNPAAVAELRRRKLREGKPLAVMVASLEDARRHARVDEAEAALLASAAAPIVLLRRRRVSRIVVAVAPDTGEIGLMLPYTPLHHLLFAPGEHRPEALVMTSGNLSEEPIATSNEEALRRLDRLADAFLLHDRPIRSRCDDSVARVVGGETMFLRRSRGFAPYPVRLDRSLPPLLAAGAELKNVFALTRERDVFLSHHIGDMENLETLQAYEDGVAHLARLFRIDIEAVAHDLHPDYMATRYALERAAAAGLPAVAVQHHHAHVAACMADNGLDPEARVIGLALDGTGYGDDGAIWGGEVLLAGYRSYRRLRHLAYVPLPGGDRAVREPWRVALAWLAAADIPWTPDLPPVAAATREELRVVRRMVELGLNAPSTSSAGRLFDAVASLAGIRQTVDYEAQAAIALEARVDPDEAAAYELGLGPSTIDPVPAVRAVVTDVREGLPVGRIAARFHRGLAAVLAAACVDARAETGIGTVALAGGVWQNLVLLDGVRDRLVRAGFRVLVHRQVPPNDGSLALGQAVVAAAVLRARS